MSLRKRLFGLATALAVGLLGLAGAGTASADTTVLGTSQPDKASLTVHKYLGATTNLNHDGTAIESDKLPKTPLAGVKFKLYKVENVDISTNDGLKLAQKIGETPLTADVVKNGISVGGTTYTLKAATPAEMTTGDDGSAKFADVERGLYVVVEDLAGSTKIMNGQVEVKKEKITPIAPFAVTLPMTNPEGTAWNSNVHVYPKNQENELNKTVVDKGVTTGNTFTYTLSTKSTGADTNGDSKMDAADLGNVYEIVDELNSNLSYVSAEVKIGGAVATADTDYTLTKTSEGNPAKDTVTIVFKGEGLNKIAAGTTIEVVLTVNLNSVPENGITPNQAKLYPNKWSKDNGKPVVSPKVETKHGDIVIKKVNKDGDVLQGAVFSVYLDNSANKDCSTYGNLIKTSEATNAEGLVKISDLQLTNFIDGKEVSEDNQVPYCLVETTAPAGYQLLPKAIPFKLTKEGTVKDMAGAITANAGNATTITNYKNPGLPLTGAQGILLVSVLGLILVSAGVVLTVKRRKD